MKLAAAWRRSTAAAAEPDGGTHGSLSTANRFEAEAYIRVYMYIPININAFAPKNRKTGKY